MKYIFTGICYCLEITLSIIVFAGQCYRMSYTIQCFMFQRTSKWAVTITLRGRR